MTFDELRDQVFLLVRDQYANTTKPDFDITNTAFLVTGDRLVVAVIAEGHPADVMPTLLRQTKAQMFCLAVAGWTKDPDTRERTGECVVIDIESPTKSELWQSRVTRDTGLPRLGDFKKADEFSGRLTHLLHQHVAH